MRIATYNTEWMGHLFDDAGDLILDNSWSRRHDVTRRAQLLALRRVFRALDADAIMVIEAPDGHPTRRGGRNGAVALETFAAWAGIRARRALLGFVNDTQQEIALLYDPDLITATHDPQGLPDPGEGEGPPRFDGSYRIDLDVDDRPETVRWSKPPLEVALGVGASCQLRLIGVHAKSKAPYGAQTPEAVMRQAIANRRKQLAQCIWLRQRIDSHLDAGDPLIVLGDLNDGPGLDDYEGLFSRSGVEIVLGTEEGRRLYDPHAAALQERRFGAMPASARFWIAAERRYMQTLLDYVMVSPDLRGVARGWRIWHPFDDPGCYGDSELREALLTGSDHFPVTLDLDLAGGDGDSGKGAIG